MAVFWLSDISISGEFEGMEIKDFRLDSGANRHASLFFSGHISREKADKLIRNPQSNVAVNVRLKKIHEFTGYISFIKASDEGDVSNVEVLLSGYSKRYDIVPLNIMFQNKKKTYADILRYAYNKAKMNGTLIAVKGGTEIGAPILLHNETPWKFTMRMAGRLNTLLIPNNLAEYPNISIGVPERSLITESTDRYRIIRHPSRSGIVPDILEQDTREYVSYEILSDNHYQLGDHVNYHSANWIVMGKSLYKKDSVIEGSYTLSSEQAYAVPRYNNSKIVGLELQGTVMDRQGEEIKLKFDIDSENSADNMTWFEYAPNTNNGMYVMPVNGEKVAMLWQSDFDHDVKGVRCCRGGAALPSHRDRHFQTEHDAHIAMLEDTTVYASVPGSKITFCPDGVFKKTNQMLAINAAKDIKIKSRGAVKIRSPQRVLFKVHSGGSAVNMHSNECHIRTPEIDVKSQDSVFFTNLILDLDVSDELIYAILGAMPAYENVF